MDDSLREETAPGQEMAAAAAPGGSHLALRWGLLLLGMFFIGTGITFSVRCNLGVFPITVLAYTLNQITGIELGIFQFFCYALLVVLQIPLLGKQFKPSILLQFPFAFLMSLFLTLCGRIYTFDLSAMAYWGRLVIFLIGILFAGTGTYFIVEAGIIINSPEGFTRVVSEKFGFRFSTTKICLDSSIVLIAAAVGLVFAGHIIGIREGTLAGAVLVGKVVALIPMSIKRRIHIACYGQAADMAKIVR